MKKILITFIVTMFFMNGWSQKYGNVTFSDVKITRLDDNLNVTFNVNPNKKTIRSNYKLILSPYIYSEGDTTNLMPIEIVGWLKSRRDRQVAILTHQQSENNSILLTKKERANYSVTIPYNSKMQKVKLGVKQTMEGCCDTKTLSDDYVASANFYQPPVVTPPQPVKKIIIKEAIIFFHLSSTIVDPEFMGNSRSLNYLMSDLGNAIEKIDIIGFASPEGIIQKNDNLAIARAEALKEYLLKNNQKISNTTFNLINGGENWVGLREMVEKSEMPYRTEVLNIIDNVTVENGRMKQLMELHSGVPYRYMLKEFFPRLRNVCCVILHY